MKTWIIRTALIFPITAGLIGICSFHSEASHLVQIHYSASSVDNVIHNLKSLFDRPYKEVTQADLDKTFNADGYLNENKSKFTEKEREEIKKNLKE